MIYGLGQDAIRNYDLKIKQIKELYHCGILPQGVLELCQIWTDALSTNSLNTKMRSVIDELHEDGDIKYKQEQVRIQNNVKKHGY